MIEDWNERSRDPLASTWLPTKVICGMNAPSTAAGTAPIGVGLVATRLAEQLAEGSVIFVAADEQRAEALAEALSIAAPDVEVLHFPSSDALPGEGAAASPANVGRRLATLRALRRRENPVVALVTTAEAAARLYPLPDAFNGMPPVLATGAETEVQGLAATLREIGYQDDEQVDEPGMMAVRGQVVDLYPADAHQPIRIEFADGRIASIKTFDPITQLTIETLDHLKVGRIDEPALGDAVTLFDHCPDATVMLDPGATRRRDRFVALVADIVSGQPGARAEVADEGRWEAALAGRTTVELVWGDARPMRRFVEARSPLRALVREVRAALASGSRVVVLGAARDLRFVGGRLGKELALEPQYRSSWGEVLDAAPGTLNLLALAVSQGWQEDGLFVLAAADVLGGRSLLQTTTTSAARLPSMTSEIHVGDVVIHEDFGVAVVAGLEPMAAGAASEEWRGDAVVLEFAGGGRRQVAVANADLLWRYGAEADAVTLDKLDGSSWHARRAGIDAAIAETARGLTTLAAEGADRTTAVLDPEPAAYERFAAGFAWVETADQARAIAAVRADLASGKPVNRLVVGDVGYGKTEVALRATALAALAGKQVAIAAPTTVLVRQHLEVFRKRFEGTGIAVAGLSRLSTPAERKAVRAGLADGTIGVVIGTAAVAAKGVAYHDLALVVIDEEQRFGAADKSRLHGLGDNLHLLTLTATPIPRTLQSALVGLQQLSIIATPPARRQPIRTSAGTFEPVRVRAALLREKARGGQSFVVVPRIEDMAAMREQLGKLVPELAFREAHGKLATAEIDEAMVAFARGDGDVLLATNIIEAGLDVPRANTMIVWRADRFGLAQLHQLRGRVGRGGRRGQVLLLTDPASEIAPKTLKRLRTLETFDRLGAGFDISARDLDVRGAGDLLGDEQAGHVKLIGVDLYQHLLEGALRAARGETVDNWRPELNLEMAGCLPEGWIPDVDVRLPLYARLARLLDSGAVDDFESELEDRFGSLPEAAETLLATVRAGLLARAAHIARIDAGPAAVAFTPRPDFARGDVAGLHRKEKRLILAERIDDPSVRLGRIVEILESLTEDEEPTVDASGAGAEHSMAA